ncbi:MAG: hypothetical protein WCO00_03505 [Rhodospirillaceae bacterium]
MDLGWIETLGVFGGAAGLFVYANLAARRPVDINRPRLWSPVLVMGLSLLVAILMLAHMVTLATGTPFRGGGF